MDHISTTAFRAPQTPMEIELCAVWAAHLGVAQVGVDDDFWARGGDATQLAALVAQVEGDWGLAVPPAFMARPTVAHLVQLWQADGEESPEENTGVYAAETRAKDGGAATAPGTSAGVVDSGVLLGLGRRGENRDQWPRWLTHRLLWRGPRVRNVALPYGIGVRLQRRLVGWSAVQTQLHSSLAVLDEWRSLLQDPTPRDAVVAAHLMAATWDAWRTRTLRQDSASFERWVTVLGAAAQDAMARAQGGVVLVVPHTHVGHLVGSVSQLRGRPRMTIRIDLQSLASKPGSLHRPEQVKYRARQVLQARDILAQNGVVFVAGDGQLGEGGTMARLGERYIWIRRGAAEMAVANDALMVPVFGYMVPDGHITLDFNDPILPEAGSRAQQVDGMTARYARLFETKWLRQYPSIEPILLRTLLAKRCPD
ncbi:MAG: phosphopantetheine-binding protein [Litorilinea sp.]